MHRTFRAAPALLFLAVASTSTHAAQRVYVASTGVDTAPCTLSQPCRSFAAAHASVDAGGEIVALDAAGFGAVNITKSVTITTNPGVFAGIAAATGSAITIDGENISVVLRGLQINGTGALYGIDIEQAGRVEIDNCVVSNFTAMGIEAAADGMTLVVTNTVARRNTSAGMRVLGGVTASVANSQFNTNAIFGVLASGANARMTVADSLFVGNAIGLSVGTGSVASVTRIMASGNVQDGIRVTEGAVIIGASQVNFNGAYGLRNDGGLLGTQGTTQVAGNGLGATFGAIGSVSSY